MQLNAPLTPTLCQSDAERQRCFLDRSPKAERCWLLQWQPVLLLILVALPSARAATFTVNMLSGPNRFSPALLTVNVGDTVTWVNQSFIGHDTVSGTNGVASGVWNSDDIFPGPDYM